MASILRMEWIAPEESREGADDKVNSLGNIGSKERFDPPSDLEKYYANNVAKQIKEQYLKILS